jgi:integrase
MPDKQDAKLMPSPENNIVPNRKITAMSAVLLPLLHDGTVDWDAFEAHLLRTAEAGLIPAVNMDTGCINLLDNQTRQEVLQRTKNILGGKSFVAGAYVPDKPDDMWDPDAYHRQLDLIQKHNATPVIFQSFGLTNQSNDKIVASYQTLARSCNRFIAFELGPMFAPFGKIYDLQTFAGIMKIKECIGAKHSSLSRQFEWQRLRLRDKQRRDFMVLSGNDLAIDMVIYGSDYLLGLSTFAPDAFALRDSFWQQGAAKQNRQNSAVQNRTRFCQAAYNRAGRIIERCKFKVWSDISASRVEWCLMDMRDGVENISIQTFNFYLQAMKQFCRWMVQNRRANQSPLKHLQKIRVLSTDKRHDRRALESEEIERLLKTTVTAPKRFNMTGYERYLVYRLACETGLRAKELKKLTVSSFDCKKFTVTVIDAYSKNRKQSILPLRKDTAMELEAYFANKLPLVKAFKMPYKTANMIKADLADAGIPYVDNAGRYADFHSLRHSTGSLLAAAGVHPKIIQSIMRHSDINLTMSRYTHIFRGQESQAIAKLPNFSFPNNSSRNPLVTGTD